MQDGEANSSPVPADAERLEREVRVLQERLAFYEGFDRLIQENVGQARELFRLAAQERDAASAEIERLHLEAFSHQASFCTELDAIAEEVDRLANAVDSLSRRVAEARSGLGKIEDRRRASGSHGTRPFAVVAHGLTSAHNALSLQRFVASLPQVADVKAREFAGGVLRLDARVRDPIIVEHIRSWDGALPIEGLTERTDVVEFAVGARSG